MLTYTLPPDEFVTRGRLLGKERILRMDENGFIIPSKRHDYPDLTLVFLGGSTTECRFVDEEIRFPYLVGHILQVKTGKRVNSYNGGVSGNLSMHSINALISKVIPLNPNIVIMMHNVNDLNTMLREGTYWNDNPTRSLVQISEISFVSSLKTLVRRAIPNLYHRLWRMKSKLRRRTRVDEFAQIRGKKLTINRDKLISEFEMSLNIFISVCRAREIIPALMTQANRITESPNSPITRKKVQTLSRSGIGYSEYKDVYDGFNEAIRRIARANDVLMIDLAKLVPQESNCIYDLYHFNNAGSKLVASIISEKLMSLAWVRDKAHPLPETGQAR